MPDASDVAAPTEIAKGTTLTGNIGREEVGGSLLHMLFTKVVGQRSALDVDRIAVLDPVMTFR